MLAGGVNAIPLYEGYMPGHKALIEFHGKLSIEYVLESVVQSAHLKDHACIVGPENEIKPVLSSYPEIAIDVDEPEDYQLIHDVLKERL